MPFPPASLTADKPVSGKPVFDTIAFDADDTLWHNEDHFAATEDAFADMVSPWMEHVAARAFLLDVETRNLELFGYGVKAFTLSMIEAAMEISHGEIPTADLGVLLERGKAMLERPAELLPGVEEVLETLSGSHRLVMITKGDLQHQEQKAFGSGLLHHFAAVEIVSEKDTQTYARIVDRHGIDASRFVMVGNSVKSDILPVLELGGYGVHIPYKFTWAHEHASVDKSTERNSAGARMWELESIRELPALLASLHS